MRLLILPLLVGLTLSGDARCVAQSDAPRPLVMLVHGRGQLGFDSTTTRREWKRDLDSALALVGMPRLRDEDVRLVWYADVLDPEVGGECSSMRAVGGNDLGAFARGLLGSLSSLMGEGDSTFLARGLLGDILYFVDRETRCAAEERVAAALAAAARDRRPVVLVAYSLGSLVTYGYLSSAQKDAALPPDIRLVTIGSPLGVREIRELVLGADTLRTPAGVKSWDNVYDPEDLFAAPLAGKVALKELRDRVTESASRADAHQIRRYLRDRATGMAIGRALCATLKGAAREACAALE